MYFHIVPPEHIKLLPHCHTLALLPGLPHFYLPFAFTAIHGGGLPLLYIIVNANGSQKHVGRPGNEASHSLSVLLCFSILSSYSWTDTCPLTKNVLCDYASADLPNHPLFSGDTRILQSSPIHPRRIPSHLARLCERCTN